ncbi:MAG TPA: AbrB/MazE/SpoVT family DNA-binding domain-containing protein [Myxococcales bacterium]|jgi:antitoxin MazE|nr:AbrB/MazE/SpoVT family DNA-binding domain-containing protein [Myxococcales bacterium]
MRKKLVKTGNSLALVLDKALLKEANIDAETELEVSTDGRVLVVSPVPSPKRSAKLSKVVEQAHRKYAGVFKRLAE